MDFDPERLKEELITAYDSAEDGLPDEVFKYITTITPMINVDLLVRDDEKGILLAWRNDYRGSGWHIPGGIIRYREPASERIIKTAEKELGAKVTFDRDPIKLTEIFVPQRIRGHFVSLLYNCRLMDGYDPMSFNGNKQPNDDGYLRWFTECPDEIVYGQREAYVEYLKETMKKS
ncbi:MAG: NUDIX hydrolase [Lachnospiraceae bacterium]|nr:NUDIX hydrolase [Lachnospiraceae bacterium]